MVTSRGMLNLLLALLLVLTLLLCGCTLMQSGGGGGAGSGSDNQYSATPRDLNATESRELNRTEISPSISPLGRVTYEYRNFSFHFRKNEYNLSIPLNTALYRGAKGASKESYAILLGGGNGTRFCDYTTAMVEEPNQSAVYAPVLESLREVKRMEDLDSDGYIELLMSFVQQIPAEASPAPYPKFPVEIIGDGNGDVHAKTMLLLGLLSEEGYDASMIFFPSTDRSAVGIGVVINTKPSLPIYKSKGGTYLYIEPSEPAFLGEVPDELASLPAVIRPLKNGSIRYQRPNEAISLVHDVKRINSTAAFMKSEIMTIGGEIRDIEGQIKNFSDSDSDFELTYIGKMNQMIARRTKYQEDLSKVEEIYAYIRDHRYDTPGVRWKIESSGVLDIHYY